MDLRRFITFKTIVEEGSSLKPHVSYAALSQP